MGKMPKIMVAVDPDEIEALNKRLDALTAEIRAVRMTPAPEWVTAHEYTKRIGRTTKTVSNLVKAGRLESKRQGRTLLIRASLGT